MQTQPAPLPAFEQSTTLNDDEKQTLKHLLETGTITEAQAREALDIHQRHKTPLRDILGSMGFVTQTDHLLKRKKAVRHQQQRDRYGLDDYRG